MNRGIATGTPNKKAYMQFCSENRKNITSENNHLSFKEVSKTLEQRWDNLSEDERQVYITKSDRRATPAKSGTGLGVNQ